MAGVRVEIVAVQPRTGARSEAMAALADSGATLTVMPGELLDRLGVPRLRTVSLVLADGRWPQREVGEAMVAVNGASVPCRVVFGEPGPDPGTVTRFSDATRDLQAASASADDEPGLAPGDYLEAAVGWE